MKLSDKILLGFFGFIFIYMTAAFIEVRVTGTRNTIDDDSSPVEKVDIPAFTYVVLSDIHDDVRIIGGERSQLEVRSFSGNVLKDLKYEMSGDTLKLWSATSTINEAFRILIFVPETFKGISVNSSDAVLRNLRMPQLDILENTGHVWMSESNIDKLNVKVLSGSHLDISSTTVDTLTLKLEKSNATVSSYVEVARGTLENSSLMLLGGLGEIQMKKDKNSNLTTTN